MPAIARYSHRRLPAKATFTDQVTVEFSGHRGCGGSIEVEVEFTATPPVAETWEQPAEGDEREIVSVRPYHFGKTSHGYFSTIRIYDDCPKWLEEILLDCIDAGELHADWSEV